MLGGLYNFPLFAVGLPEKIYENRIQLKQKISIFLLRIMQHKPGSRLKLRMGMHSGRVVGGVVGTKIPHYSVFG